MQKPNVILEVICVVTVCFCSQIDLKTIKNEYEERYQKTIDSKVRSHTKGPFKHLLLAILRGNRKDGV